MSEKYTITSDETNLKIPHDNLAYDDETVRKIILSNFLRVTITLSTH